MLQRPEDVRRGVRMQLLGDLVVNASICTINVCNAASNARGTCTAAAPKSPEARAATPRCGRAWHRRWWRRSSPRSAVGGHVSGVCGLSVLVSGSPLG